MPDQPTDTNTIQPQLLPASMSGFVRTRCMTCAAGWTRLGEQDQAVVVCLLDRAPVWPEMLACNRYELADHLTLTR